MKTLAQLALATMALALGSPALAQYLPGYPGAPTGGYPGVSPPFSPYLNIVGRGNPAFNYYGITRPQMEFRNALFGGAQGSGIPFEAEDPYDPQMRRGTGHAVTFGNLSHYYYNNPALGGRTGGAGTGIGRAGGIGGAGVSGFGSGYPGSSGRGYTPPRGGLGATGY